MYNEEIKLILTSESIDNSGDIISSTTSKTVFAKEKSIGQSEFYQANTLGFKPEIKFVIADYLDYNNESEVIHNNIKYKILRTFKSDDRNELEIVCYGGVRNVNS